MKKARLLGAMCAVLFTFITVSANAALVGRLPVTPGGNDFQAAYDDVLDITWVTNGALSGLGTWYSQTAWAANLDYLGFDDWRLAAMSVSAGLPTGTTGSVVDCRSATELACRDNELGYMYYYNLAGSGCNNCTGPQWIDYSPSCSPSCGWILTVGQYTDDSFQLIGPYYSLTEASSNEAWNFSFDSGNQYYIGKVPLNLYSYGWAVRAGDVGGPDADGDGIDDADDNCTLVANPDQRDSNNDGYGNFCDGDINSDCAINFIDLGEMKAAFFSDDEDTDLDGDGVVNFIDLGLIKNAFFGTPGPSGLAGLCES